MLFFVCRNGSYAVNKAARKTVQNIGDVVFVTV